MFEDLAQSYNSVITAFNELATTLETTTDQINFIMGALKVGGIILAIFFIVLMVIILAMNSKINALRKQNDEIIEQFKLTIVFLKRGRNNGTNDKRSNEGDNSRS